MTLAPGATITLGDLQYTEQAVTMAATLTALPGVNWAVVTLPAGVRFQAAPGDDGVLELDSGDAGGAGAGTVLTGKVWAVRRSVASIQVTLGDAGAELAKMRPAKTFENGSAKDVIRALAGEAGVTVDSIDLDLPLPCYVVHQGRTAAEHVAYLTQLGGGMAGVNGAGELFAVAWPDGQPELALRYGRELLEYQVSNLPPATARNMRIGFGAAGSATAPGALRPSVEALPAGAPSPGSGAVWLPSAALRVPKAANTASDGADVFAGAYAQQVQARGYLLPKLRPGKVIEVQDTPDGLAGGSWIVTRVVHRLSPQRGGSTVFQAVSGEGGLGGLLGAGLGAAGALL